MIANQSMLRHKALKHPTARPHNVLFLPSQCNGKLRFTHINFLNFPI